MLEQYIELIQRFVGGEISADDFEDRYIKLWYAALGNFLSETTPQTEIISDLFLEVDALTNEPPFDTTPEELRSSAEKALSQLVELQKEHNP